MQLKTLLNQVHKCKGFVYQDISLVGHDGLELLVQVAPRKRTRPTCSVCGRRAVHYDTLKRRRFQFVPLWGIDVFFVYAMRRVKCPRCGVKVEKVPWAESKSPMTTSYAWFLSHWATKLSWQETAKSFGTSWHMVFNAARMAVEWGLAHRDLSEIRSIGVDEVAWQKKGTKFLTVVYQIAGGCRRLLWIGRDRTKACLNDFFDEFGERASLLQFVCSDMWGPYLTVIKRRAGQAIHVLDRFHIVSNLNKAVDEVRAGEARKMARDGYDPLLKHGRWCLLKRPENLTAKQNIKLAELLQYNLRSMRAYLLKEELQLMWGYVSPTWAGKFLDAWCTKVMRSKLEPMKRQARTLRRHRELILNWFRARGELSSGPVEGMNNKLKVITRRAYGFKTFKAAEVALYHGLGKLPVPEFTHKFF